MSVPDFNVVVPARYASTRLPGKPLLDLGGEPMLLRTVAQVKRSGAAEVIVATDDQRIEQACLDANVDVMMTSADHPSGTDRMYEVVAARGWSDDGNVPRERAEALGLAGVYGETERPPAAK